MGAAITAATANLQSRLPNPIRVNTMVSAAVAKTGSASDTARVTNRTSPVMRETRSPRPGPFDVALRKVENPDDDFFAKVGDNALADAGEQVVAHSDEKG